MGADKGMSKNSPRKYAPPILEVETVLDKSCDLGFMSEAGHRKSHMTDEEHGSYISSRSVSFSALQNGKKFKE